MNNYLLFGKYALNIYIENFLILHHLYIETPSNMQSSKRCFGLKVRLSISILYFYCCYDPVSGFCIEGFYRNLVILFFVFNESVLFVYLVAV